MYIVRTIKTNLIVELVHGEADGEDDDGDEADRHPAVPDLRNQNPLHAAVVDVYPAVFDPFKQSRLDYYKTKCKKTLKERLQHNPHQRV